MFEGIRVQWRFGAIAALIGCVGLVAAALAFADASGTQFRVTNHGHDGTTSYFSRLQDTSYNPQTNQYLVVFYNGDPVAGSTVSGQFVDAAGNLVGGPFPISPTAVDQNPPSVTYNATNNEFLVSWYTGSGLQAQRVSASGALLGSVIPVSSDSYNDIETLDLAWSPEGNEYLVGWKADGAGGQQIYGRRIAGDGTPLDATDLQISHIPATVPGSQADDAMALAYNTTDHEFLVVYRGWNYGQGPNGEYEIWGQRVALGGSDVGPGDFRISHFGSDTDTSYYHGSRPRVAYDASRNQYLVTFMENLVQNQAGVEVFGQFVAANGDLAGSTFQISNRTGGDANAGVNGPDVVYDQFADLYLSVFQFGPSVGSNSNAEIYGDYVTGSGALTGTRDFPISDMGSSTNTNLGGFRPSVAFNSQTCSFMANWWGDTTQGSLVNNEWEIWGRLVTAPPCPPPSATTGNATGVTQTSATLSGTVNAKGHAATYHFEYGTTTSYGSSTPDQNNGSDFADHAESAAISGLAPGTTYHFRIVATNAYGTTAGADQVFTTAAPTATPAAAKKPTVTTGSARRIIATSAALSGTLNPNGTSTTYQFQFGRTTKYGKTTAAASAGSGTAQVVANARIRGLKPGVTYHYRLVATNSAGTTTGADRTFTTTARLAVRGIRSGCTTNAFRLSLGVTAAVGLRSLRVYVDGRRVASSTRKQLSVIIRSLKAGHHTVRVVVTPRRGSSVARTVTYRACRAPTFTG